MPETATTPKPDTAASRSAIRNALKLIATARPESATSGHVVLPTATVRDGLDILIRAGTIHAFTVQSLDLKAVAAKLFNWLEPSSSKAVMKAMKRALEAEDANGKSLYPQAVEMISFAAAAAPLLDPDRLIRLIESAHTAEVTYAPIVYTAATAEKLKRVLDQYQPARRIDLLIDLWTVAHEDRWWNATANLAGTPRRRRRRIIDEDAAPIDDQAIGQALADGTATPEAVADALDRSTVPLTPQAMRTMRAMNLTAAQRARFKELSVGRNHVDQDHTVLLAALRDALPDERPENPIPKMLDILLASFDEASPEDQAKFFPKKPTEWSQLYPDASLKGFPYPQEILDLDFTTLPGCDAASVELIRSSNGLRRNATEMGNCTFSYNNRCETGEHAIGRIVFEGSLFNFSITYRVGHGWHVGEVNSQFNRGNVPPPVREGVTAMAAAATAARQ